MLGNVLLQNCFERKEGRERELRKEKGKMKEGDRGGKEKRKYFGKKDRVLRLHFGDGKSNYERPDYVRNQTLTDVETLLVRGRAIF